MASLESRIYQMAEKACIPIAVHFDLTHRCILRCKHCYLPEKDRYPSSGYREELKKQNRSELTTQEVYGILDQLAEYGTLFLCFSGGEIFVRRDMMDIIQYAKEKRFNVSLMTTGNAGFDEKAHSIVILRELVEILKALSDMQIEVIVLKGAALASTIYPDIALRPYEDIDLLVRKHDWNRIEAAFSQLGYRALHSYRPEFSREFLSEKCYTKGKIPIDLHWHIVELPYSKYIAIDQFWKSAVTVNIDGVDALILSPEHLLLHLCVHSSKHYYSCLYQLVDISELIHHYSLNWRLILEEIQRYRIYFPMRYTLNFVKRLFDSHIPAFVLESLDSYKVSSFEERIFDVLSNPDIVDHRKNSIAIFLAIPGIKSKVRYIFSQLFPCRERLLTIYPGRRVFSAYRLRVSDIIADVMRVMLKLVWRPGKIISSKKSG